MRGMLSMGVQTDLTAMSGELDLSAQTTPVEAEDGIQNVDGASKDMGSTTHKEMASTSYESDESLLGGAVDPLHNVSPGGVNYKSMSWWHCGLLMIAETISLGVLSLPYAVASLGLIPGIISIFGLGLLATYSGYVIGQFKVRYPEVHSMADAGFILFGSFGYHLFCWAALLSFIFIMAAHILTFSVAMNVLTDHATCSIVWAVIGTIISILITLPRTLKNISYYSMLSCLSITIAVFILMVSVGVNNKTGDHGDGLRLNYTFSPTILAILNITIAYMGNVAFFGFISELREPRDFTKALFFLQGCTVAFYIMVATLIYCYVGPSVVSPALGSTNPTVKKIAYGIALVTIIVAGVVNAHVACKQIYVQVWRNNDPRMVTSRSFKAKGSWILIVTASWLLAFILALAIPIFSQMLGLISALFGSWFTYGVCGMFWIKMNWDWLRGRGRGRAVAQAGDEVQAASEQQPRLMAWKSWGLLALNIGMMLLAAAMCGLGLYVTGADIAHGEVGEAFSCADNAP